MLDELARARHREVMDEPATPEGVVSPRAGTNQVREVEEREHKGVARFPGVERGVCEAHPRRLIGGPSRTADAGNALRGDGSGRVDESVLLQHDGKGLVQGATDVDDLAPAARCAFVEV